MTITYDEINDLAESIPGLQDRRLMPTWAYIQSIKYSGMTEEGDCNQPNIIFLSCELPLIRRLYPEEQVTALLRKLMSGMLGKAKSYSKAKFQRYLELRRYGMPIDKARREIAPVHSERFLVGMAVKYNQRVEFRYDISCRDADLIYNMGMDGFIRLFYDRFIKTNENKHDLRN